MKPFRAVVAMIVLLSSWHWTSNLANAQIVASSMSTSIVIETCGRAQNPLQIDCAGYILGVYDTLSLTGLICPPRNPQGGTWQAVAVALRFLNQHPERWHLAPAALIGDSFKSAFPCK